MIRILSFVALGGAVSLLILSSTGSSVFGHWNVIFFIAAAVLFVFEIGRRIIKRTIREGKEIRAAKAANRIRAARILSRSQTGTFINENPQVEFKLLVDRPGEMPFQTTVREVVPMIDVHKFDEGKLLTVVHPNLEYGDVHVVEEPTPAPSRWLTQELGNQAQQLPADPQGRNVKGVHVSAIITMVGAFLLGAVGAPYLATPDAHEYVPHIFSNGLSYTEEVQFLDYQAMTAEDTLQSSIELLVEELGHEEAYSVRIYDVWMSAEVPVEIGTAKTDEITIRNIQIEEREPALIQPSKDDETFNLNDVDWDAVLAAIPEAEVIAKERAEVDETELQMISVEKNTFTNLKKIEVEISFQTPYDSQTVTLNADGQLLPSESFSLLPEEEKLTHLFDVENYNSALNEMIEATDAEQVTRILNYGDRAHLHLFRPLPSGKTQNVEVQFREGQLYDIGDEQNSNDQPEDAFDPNDFDWQIVADTLPKAQQVLAAEGVSEPVPNYVIIERDRIPNSDSAQLVARIYLKNEADENGYVEIDSSGDITRVSSGG